MRRGGTDRRARDSIKPLGGFFRRRPYKTMPGSKRGEKKAVGWPIQCKLYLMWFTGEIPDELDLEGTTRGVNYNYEASQRTLCRSKM
jgi:hypothetical protein